jgi:hypothetical protein
MEELMKNPVESRNRKKCAEREREETVSENEIEERKEMVIR